MKRFWFYGSVIDIGENELVQKKYKRGTGAREQWHFVRNRNVDIVQTVDLKKKLNPMTEKLNEINQKLKNPPGTERLIALDESLRASYSRLDPLRTYMPSKPCKYGNGTHSYSS